jgi:hypothetical protein
MEFLRADIHVARENIVGDDVLDKGGLVVLFLVIILCLIESDSGDGAEEGEVDGRWTGGD